MQPDLTPLLADPNDGSPLDLHPFSMHMGAVRDGILLSPRTRRWYPVRDGIPTVFADALRPDDSDFATRFRTEISKLGGEVTNVSDKPRDFARIESERRARDEQAEDYDRMISLKALSLIETPAYRRAMFREDELSRLPILEAGCGTGRFTQLFSSEGPPVVALDLSRDSIERNRTRHRGRTRSVVHYLHADLTHLPLKSNAFGRVAHVGVYEHIPSRELRQQFLAHAQRVLAPNGTLLLSAYRYDGFTKRFEKEGEHAGGIPFFRFTEAELKAEVEPFFDITYWRGNLGVYMSMLTGTPKE